MTTDIAHIVLDAGIEVIEATVPVLVLIAFFQFVVLRSGVRNPRAVITGIAMAMVGFFLFIVGAKMSLIPMGVAIGERLVDAPLLSVVGFAFILGTAVALAEPAVRILALEIEDVSAGSMRRRVVTAAIALGVGLAIAVAVVRITAGLPLTAVLTPGYALVIVLTLLAPRDLVPAAFDAGAVATGPVAVNFVLPLTTGMAMGLWGQDVGSLGFGVVGIIALGPIITMLALSLALRRRDNHV
ncbi:MAG: DUF1538 domain-containing protein [Trueperaceae bacterium]|nr:DUF1538 domain-containing protein [Trueperaceae bacterium]